jgi:hypothetical protein
MKRKRCGWGSNPYPKYHSTTSRACGFGGKYDRRCRRLRGNSNRATSSRRIVSYLLAELKFEDIELQRGLIHKPSSWQVLQPNSWRLPILSRTRVRRLSLKEGKKQSLQPCTQTKYRDKAVEISKSGMVC